MATPRDPEATRTRLLQAAFDEIHTRGYQGMRINEVLRQANLEKGALYHHFGGKIELGYRVLDEVVRPMIDQYWIAPLRDCADPLACIIQRIHDAQKTIRPEGLKLGCPLMNLSQEMSPIDEGFRLRIVELFVYWIDALKSALARAQGAGQVRADVDAEAAARFIISSIEGCVAVAKSEQAKRNIDACVSQLTLYLDALRQNPVPRPG